MKLGDKVRFQKELKKLENTRTEETVEFALKNRLIDERRAEAVRTSKTGYPMACNWGVVDNKQIIEGTYCGKRLIDMTGQTVWDEGYEFGKRILIHLVATNVMGFHRVPEEFLINDASST